MTPEVQAKAFEPFFTTKGPGAGSGLGLSQVFGTAHQSGGDVQIDSAPGKGTSVSVFLPRADGRGRAYAVAPAAVVAETRSVAGRRADRGRRRCGARDHVGPAERAWLHGASRQPDGAAALELLDRGAAIDLLLTDVVMPGMSGPELARRVRGRCGPALPIVFISGYADPDGHRRADYWDVWCASHSAPASCGSRSKRRSTRRAPRIGLPMRSRDARCCDDRAAHPVDAADAARPGADRVRGLARHAVRSRRASWRARTHRQNRWSDCAISTASICRCRCSSRATSTMW